MVVVFHTYFEKLKKGWTPNSELKVVTKQKKSRSNNNNEEEQYQKRKAKWTVFALQWLNYWCQKSKCFRALTFCVVKTLRKYRKGTKWNTQSANQIHSTEATCYRAQIDFSTNSTPTMPNDQIQCHNLTTTLSKQVKCGPWGVVLAEFKKLSWCVSLFWGWTWPF